MYSPRMRFFFFFLIMYMKHQAVLENLKVKKAGNMMLEPWYIYLDQKIENAFDFFGYFSFCFEHSPTQN